MNAEAKAVEENMKEQPIDNPVAVPIGWNLWQRINWVRSQVSYVKKTSTVSGGGTYKAVSHDAVTASLRGFMVQAGILVFPALDTSASVDSGSTTKTGVPILRYEARFNVTFLNADNPEETYCLPVDSHALDFGDKAPGKAISYAQKYALLKMFSIETGEDDESRIEQRSKEDTAAELEAIRQERLNLAVSQHMDSIQAIKTSIRDAVPLKIDGNPGQFDFQNPDLLSTGIEAWLELTDDEKKSIWVAPSKGKPFSTEERAVMKSDRWAELRRGAFNV